MPGDFETGIIGGIGPQYTTGTAEHFSWSKMTKSAKVSTRADFELLLPPLADERLQLWRYLEKFQVKFSVIFVPF